jgi:regulator of nucleoside diphosphate kinase
MREKLAMAELVAPELLPSDVVTLNSRVLHQVADNAPEALTLVEGGSWQAGHALPLASPAGICLLGLRQGDEAVLPSSGGPPRRVRVLSVLYQPENAHRSFFGELAGREDSTVPKTDERLRRHG